MNFHESQLVVRIVVIETPSAALNMPLALILPSPINLFRYMVDGMVVDLCDANSGMETMLKCHVSYTACRTPLLVQLCVYWNVLLFFHLW